MVNASVPFAVRVRGRRKPTAQKKDACAVKDTVELFWFSSFFALSFAFSFLGGGGPGEKDLIGEGGGGAIGIMRVSYVVIDNLSCTIVMFVSVSSFRIINAMQYKLFSFETFASCHPVLEIL